MSLYASVAPESQVFSENAVIRDGIRLKDFKPVREAVIFNELSHLPQKKLRQFVRSPEARQMVKEEFITPGQLEDLTRDAYGDKASEFMICHMAAENGDERWDELVRLRAQEREIMNQLIRDYQDAAKPYADNYRSDHISKIPPEYRTGYDPDVDRGPGHP